MKRISLCLLVMCGCQCGSAQFPLAYRENVQRIANEVGSNVDESDGLNNTRRSNEKASKCSSKSAIHTD